MTFKEGLLGARSHLVFLLAIIFSFALILRLEGVETGPTEFLELEAEAPKPPTHHLDSQHEEWARIAWRYFEKNERASTGLVDSVSGYPATTLWDTGSYLLAIIAAHRLEIIDQYEADRRLEAALGSLEKMPLVAERPAGGLPNKSYNTETLNMVDYNNQAAPEGIGWSAIDAGRLMVPLHVLVWHYPQHTSQVRRVFDQWDFSRLVRDGTLFGGQLDETARPESESVRYSLVQEGRLGYEEYSARAFALGGLDTSVASRFTDFLRWVPVFDERIATDSRDARDYVAHNVVVSEPYVLDGLELGFDRVTKELAFRVFKAQQQRYESTGVLTAVSEDHLDRPPHFAYYGVVADGKLWHAIDSNGRDADDARTLSTKTAFGWHALFTSRYTKLLLEDVRSLHDPEGGWYAGRYEESAEANDLLTCNTNAVVLESLHYMAFGPMVRFSNFERL
ncbi:MAG: DUF3131 domain-containing protein [Acidobacteriota bacterium]